MNGYIKLHRRILDWEWYGDAVVMRVFLHILLNAARSDCRIRGNAIQAGQYLTTYNAVAEALGLSVQQVRTALGKLKATGSATGSATGRGLLITVENWAEYQIGAKKATGSATGLATGNQQANNRLATFAIEQEGKEDKEYINNNIYAGANEAEIALPLSDGTQYAVGQKDVSELAQLYGSTDIVQELKNMKGWLLANPNRKKTRRGIRRFINNWLCNANQRKQEEAQNRYDGHTSPSGQLPEAAGAWELPDATYL